MGTLAACAMPPEPGNHPNVQISPEDAALLGVDRAYFEEVCGTEGPSSPVLGQIVDSRLGVETALQLDNPELRWMKWKCRPQYLRDRKGTAQFTQGDLWDGEGHYGFPFSFPIAKWEHFPADMVLSPDALDAWEEEREEFVSTCEDTGTDPQKDTLEQLAADRSSTIESDGYKDLSAWFCRYMEEGEDGKGRGSADLWNVVMPASDQAVAYQFFSSVEF